MESAPPRPRSTLRPEEEAMCYTCGCKAPQDLHGNPANITDQHFRLAAEVAKESPEQAMRNTLELLKERLGEK
jgi:hypothetical protein